MVKCKYWAVVCPFLLLFIPDVHSIDWNTAYTPEGKLDLENVLPYKNLVLYHFRDIAWSDHMTFFRMLP